jgi:hypothetical protein
LKISHLATLAVFSSSQTLFLTKKFASDSVNGSLCALADPSLEPIQVEPICQLLCVRRSKMNFKTVYLFGKQSHRYTLQKEHSSNPKVLLKSVLKTAEAIRHISSTASTFGTYVDLSFFVTLFMDI